VECIKVHVIGPGYGETIVLEFQDGSVGIIDPYCSSQSFLTATNRSQLHPIIRFLENEIKPEKIRFVVVSHPHSDHCLGTVQFIKHFVEKIERIWLFSDFESSELWITLNSKKKHYRDGKKEFHDSELLREELADIADIKNWCHVKPTYIGEGYHESVSLLKGSIEVNIYAPVRKVLSDYTRKLRDIFKDVTISNENMIIPINELPSAKTFNHFSIVMQVEYKRTKLLFCADAQDETWDEIFSPSKKNGLNLKSHMVKISHHGSLNGYNDQLLTHFTKKNLPVGVLTPFNRNKKLPSFEALKKISPHFEIIATTCFPGCPDLHIWQPKQPYTNSITDHKVTMPVEWLNDLSKDERLKNFLIQFSKNTNPQKVPLSIFPADWTDQICHNPSLISLLCEPYRTAVFYIIESIRTGKIEDLFRVSYTFDTSGNIRDSYHGPGAATYKINSCV